MELGSGVQDLLASLENLSFAERWKTMVEVGRRSMRSPGSCEDAASQDELQGDLLRSVLVSFADSEVHYERMLAAMAFRGMIAEALVQKRQPPPDVLTALTKLMLDPSSKIFKLVATPLAQFSTDEALKEVLIQATRKQFTVLSNAIMKSGKSHIMHDLYNEQKQCEEEKGSGNLSVAKINHKITSTRNMEKLYAHLPEDKLRNLPVNDLFALDDNEFRKLTILNPRLISEILIGLKTQLNNESHTTDNTSTENIPSPENKDVLQNRVDSRIFNAAIALSILNCKESVDIGMKLMKEALCSSNVSKWDKEDLAGAYIRVQAVKTYEFIVQHKEMHNNRCLQVKSRRVLKKLQSNLPLLFELYEIGLLNANLFRFLPNSERNQFYNTLIRSLCIGKNNNVVPMNVVSHIASQALREKTAKQMFHLKDLQTSPDKRIEYLGLLPFHEALELCQPFLKDPKSEIRGSCAAALINGVTYYPAHMEELLAFILKQMNEQDPWREAMFNSLVRLPFRVWKQEHLSYVDKLIQANFDAKDVSIRSMNAAQRLLVRIAERFPVYAAEKLFLFMEREVSKIEGLDKLSCSSIEKFISLLFPRIKKQILEKKGSLPSSILHQLNPRQRLLKDILKPIYDCYMDLENPLEHLPALEFYYNTFRHEAIHKIIPGIEYTKGIMFNNIVGTVLYKHHQGRLLNFCLESLKPADDETSDSPNFFISDYLTSFNPLWNYRFTLKQQQTLAKLLLSLYTQEDPWIFTARQFFKCIAQFPSITIDDGLRPFVQSDHKDVCIRDTAIFALRLMNDAASLEELKNAIQDSRERHAVVALTSRLKLHPVRSVVKIVSSALKTCRLVTSKKHLVCFLGALADEDALDLLLQLWKESDSMHEDVKLAMQNAFWNHLDHEKVWEFYENAVKSSRSAECIKALSIRDESLHYDWQLKRMNGLLLRLLQNKDTCIQLAVLKRLSNSPSLGNRAILEEALGFLSYLNDEHIKFAMQFILHYRNIPPEEVSKMLADLKDDRDIAIAVETLVCEHTRCTPSVCKARLEYIANALYEHLILKGRQPTLICQLVLMGSLDLLESRLMEMINQNLLHTGAASYVVSELPNYTRKYPLTVIQTLERSLRQHAHPFLRRCGLAMAQGVGDAYKWPLEYCEALEVYKQDSDLWIQNDAALMTAHTFEENSNNDPDE